VFFPAHLQTSGSENLFGSQPKTKALAYGFPPNRKTPEDDKSGSQLKPPSMSAVRLRRHEQSGYLRLSGLSATILKNSHVSRTMRFLQFPDVSDLLLPYASLSLHYLSVSSL
jgi:hypothetical protein